MGLAPALFEEISYDEFGNVQGGSFIDYLVPTAVETPKWRRATPSPSPHHPLGAKGVGESSGGRPRGHRQRVVERALPSRRPPVGHPDHAAKVWKLLRGERRHRE